MVLGQNLVALVNIKIAGKWVFTPLTLIIIGFDIHPHGFQDVSSFEGQTSQIFHDLPSILAIQIIQLPPSNWTIEADQLLDFQHFYF